MVNNKKQLVMWPKNTLRLAVTDTLTIKDEGLKLGLKLN